LLLSIGPSRNFSTLDDFIAEPLAIAERRTRCQPRRFIDFDEFMSNKWERHELVIGSNHNAYDRCHHIALCDHRHAPYPLHTLARPYIEEIIRCQRGEIATIYDQALLERQAPLYFTRPQSGSFACVDLDAAYWQLYRVASLDLDYDGLATPKNGRVRFLGSEELRPHKLLRNAIIGTIRAEYRTEANYGLVSSVATGPRFRRPALWAWLMDTLEAVAWEVRMFFAAVHVQIDGYIVPTDVAQSLIEWLKVEWGLQASIRASGHGVITGLGNWQIEDEQVGEAEPHRAGMEHFDNMVKRDWTGLREWYVDNLAHYNETPTIKLLDSRECPW
jgi:hypothetical protein